MTEPKTPELLPCLLCKGEAELDTMRHVNSRPDQGLMSEPAIYCLDCGLELTDSYGEGDIDDDQIVEMLIDKWNTRPTPPVGKCPRTKNSAQEFDAWYLSNYDFVDRTTAPTFEIDDMKFAFAAWGKRPALPDEAALVEIAVSERENGFVTWGKGTIEEAYFWYTFDSHYQRVHFSGCHFLGNASTPEEAEVIVQKHYAGMCKALRTHLSNGEDKARIVELEKAMTQSIKIFKVN